MFLIIFNYEYKDSKQQKYLGKCLRGKLNLNKKKKNYNNNNKKKFLFIYIYMDILYIIVNKFLKKILYISIYINLIFFVNFSLNYIT